MGLWAPCYTAGAWPWSTSFDGINLTSLLMVADIHRAYIAAGADIIETNSFGANRYKLAEYGLQQQVTAVNQAAVNIARRVIDSAFRDVWLAGSVGPLGVRLAPLGRVSLAEAADAFREQIEALLTATSTSSTSLSNSGQAFPTALICWCWKPCLICTR